MNTMKLFLLIVIGLLFLFGDYASSQEVLTLSGSWTEDIGTSDLTGPAGSNLNSQYTSATNVVTANITRTGYNLFTNWDWQVTIQKSDINWDDSLELSARRSSNGIGFGTIQNGTTYQVVGGTASNFFNGTRHRYIIGMQYQLNNVSATIPAESYICEVIYTVYEY